MESAEIIMNNNNCLKNFKRGKMIGNGSFAKCYEINFLGSNETQAVKIISKSLMSNTYPRDKLMSEIIIHKSLNHRNIVKL